jgi:leucyl-tRNA synthetase
MSYDFKAIEEKWRKRWQKHPIAQTKPTDSGPKYYCLDMFPYPSGSGLHVGHWRGYVLSDIYARIKWLQGFNVLHPMGWDAFGLPAENDAIKKNILPQIGTERNIANFKKQLQYIGAIYDWSKEINTTDPDYYKWTQWIFLQMYKLGLAYQAEVPINWCPSCLTGLANEEVVNGACERCGTPVTQKSIRQWMLKITKYADKLLEGLNRLDWPDKVKLMQRNWIGKSEGLLFAAPVKDSSIIIQTFSAHFESFKADSFVVIAPDHPLLAQLLEGVANKQDIFAVCDRIIKKRMASKETDVEPEGIFTGRYIVDPVSKNLLPIWVANFALADYGTGIIKCSAHDERDFKFAKKYNIPLKVVLVPPDPNLRKAVENLEVCYTNMQEGILLEPAEFKGKISGDVRQDIIEYCVKKGYATPKISYKLRDWVFSRQRYWGEPIPIIHCSNCGVVPVPEKDLPVTLPAVENYKPTGTGESPLAAIDWWVNTDCPQCGGPAKRETNTMPQWAGSSWYFLRYPNPHLKDKPFTKEDMNYWLPVDLYVGGIEHAILHLLYARFYTKVLHDLEYLPFDEPFAHLFNQGMITKYSELSGHVEKMSKSRGNVVNPDDIVAQYGTDVLRAYMLFMGPPEMDAEWQDSGLEGVKRFVNRLWNYLTDVSTIVADEDIATTKRFHQFLKEFQERVEAFKPNTAISAAMEWVNDATAGTMKISKKTVEQLLVTLSIMMPHFAAQLLEQLLGKQLQDCQWPSYDPVLAEPESIEIVVQVNGKLRAHLKTIPGLNKEIIEQQAKALIQSWLLDKTIRNVIYVPDRLINFVIS